MSEKQKILIVDDKKANLFALEVTLSESNAQIIQASGGNEALRLSLSHDFALAILDVQMPVMSGYELAEYLRGDNKTKHIPIIFLTASLIQETDIFKGYESGAVDYILKPYTPASLISKVNVFLELDYDKRELIKIQESLETANRTLKVVNDRVSQELRWYEDIVSTSTDFLLFIDTEYTYRAVNTSYLKYFELSRDDVIGTKISGVQEKIVFKGLTKKRIKACLSGSYIQFQEWIESTTRGLRCLDVHLEPFMEMDGSITGAVVNGRDISERKHAEVELMRSEEKFRLVVESASDGMMFVNEHGEITLVNKQLELMTGYSRKELIGQPMEKLIPDRINEYKQLRDDYISTPRKRPMGIGKELYAQRKDGSDIPVEISLNPVKTEEGLVISAVIVDITERKRAEDALRLDATTFETHEGIVITDKDGNVLRVNGAFSEITGFCEEEVIGYPSSLALQSEHNDDAFYQQIQTDILELGRWEGESYSKRKNGETYIIWLNITAVKDEKGNVTNHVAHFSDISELREQQSNLIQAQKMEAVGQLTGGIAHDFNNLLSIISGNLRFLRQEIGESSKDVKELFEDAMSAARDGTELTQRLLGFSRTRKLAEETIKVNEAIDQSIRLLSRTLEKNIELETDLTNRKLFICVDPPQLENALLNLCINARDAMPDGGKIVISTRHYYQNDGSGSGDGFSLRLPEGNYVKISVTDTGSGIRLGDIQHVFEPFFTTKDVGRGSGLGLSMVFGFSQQSNGDCHVNSTPGEGTTVSMFFPAFTERRAIDRSPEDTKGRQEKDLHGSEVILVVEDEPRVRRVALRDLRILGYKTLEAENADMAKTIIESGEHIDLIFSDVLMPGEMDGPRLAAWTREYFPQIKIVLVSGFSQGKADKDKDKDKDKTHPFPLLRKPYNVDQLARKLKAVLVK